MYKMKIKCKKRERARGRKYGMVLHVKKYTKKLYGVVVVVVVVVCCKKRTRFSIVFNFSWKNIVCCLARHVGVRRSVLLVAMVTTASATASTCTTD